MTEKRPYVGATKNDVRPYDGKRHRHSTSTVELAFRVRYSLIDELNNHFLAHPTHVNFSDFMREITQLGLETYRAKNPSPVSDVQSGVART